MGFGGKVVKQDPEADALAAAEKATAEANTKKAMRRTSANASALGGATDTATNKKTTLGGG